MLIKSMPLLSYILNPLRGVSFSIAETFYFDKFYSGAIKFPLSNLITERRALTRRPVFTSLFYFPS